MSAKPLTIYFAYISYYNYDSSDLLLLVIRLTSVLPKAKVISSLLTIVDSIFIITLNRSLRFL